MKCPTRRLAAVALAALLPLPCAASAAVSAGSLVEITPQKSLHEMHSDVAMRANGEFVVAWERFPDLYSGNVLVRRFAADGTPLGKTFVLTSAAGHQGRPAVAVADDGRFLVAWHGAGAEDSFGAYARLFHADGSPATAPFLLHEPSPFTEENTPSVTTDGDGFAVAWVDGGATLVRFDASGNVRPGHSVGESGVNTVSVVNLPGGNLALAWSATHDVSLSQDSEGDVGRVRGVVLTPADTVEREFLVNEPRRDTSYDYFVDGQQRLSVSASADGDLAVAHDSNIPRYLYNVDDYDGPFPIGARLEIFDPAGETASSLYLADVPTEGTTADVAMSPGGNTLASVETGRVGIRAVDCHGLVLGDELVQVSAEGASASSIAVGERGDGVVVWSELHAGQYVLRGRRFSMSGGCALCGDADANGAVSATDALLALRTAVGTGTCPADRCDVNASAVIATDDALRILRVSVGVVGATLACSDGPRIDLTDSVDFHASPFGWEARFSFFADGDGAVLAWSESGLEGGRTFSRRVSATLDLEPMVPVAGPDLGAYHFDANGCGGEGGAALAWAVERNDFFPEGTILDLSTVYLALPGGPVVEAHPDSIGEHRLPSVACLSDGRYAVSWMSRCRAIDLGIEGTGDEEYFRPEECDDAPADGANVRVLEADGSPATGALSILEDDELHQQTALAPLASGFVAAAGSRIQVRSNDGDLVGETTVEIESNEVSLACLGNRCVRTDDARLLLFDADNLADVQELIVQPARQLGPTRSITPVHVAVACESGGVCVAAWVDLDVASAPPYWSSDDLEIHVRPFELATGKLGEALRLPARTASGQDFGLAAVEPGVFLFAVEGDWYEFVVHRLEVR